MSIVTKPRAIAVNTNQRSITPFNIVFLPITVARLQTRSSECRYRRDYNEADALLSKNTRHLSTDGRNSCSLRLRVRYARSHHIGTVSSDNDISDSTVGDTGIPFAEASCRLVYSVLPIRPGKPRCQSCYGAWATDGRRRNACWIRAGDGRPARAATAQEETSVGEEMPPHYH
jgi:hypothetical protein